MSVQNLWEPEHGFFDEGYRRICGVDEAGRGPLAGPVCAAAVILPPDMDIPGLNDSKQVPDKKRRELFELITANAVAFGIAFAGPEEVDEVNILQATFLAMRRAVEQLKTAPDLVLVDGNREPLLPYPVRTIIKGDCLSANIAAASILAKVTRDRYMEQAAERYPWYGFEIHKGYGTRRHYEALRESGPCPLHRQSFLRKFYGEK